MPIHEGLFRFSLLLLFVPVLLGAGFGFFLTWNGLRRRAELRSWPSVEIRVLSSEVESTEYRSWYFTRTRSWDFIIDFEYDYAGRDYRSRVRLEADVPGGGEPDPQVLENAIAQARRRLLEKLVMVRVNPDNPSETAWISEPAGRAQLRLAVFAAAALCSLAVLFSIFTS
ncbi:DUF3592 domain-containing protein [Paucidesulfovibrio longus]|uniref:DUF3592 domain-containing protein n=1 Tax=Paucidesulfovibrio longus TaxID=889 RepID=UPI0003B37AEE|nr:DUF3592 domain-containing protein [Paucidesulfovibrio longus]